MKKVLKKAAAFILSLCIVIPAFPASATTMDGEFNYYLLESIIDLYLESSLYETDKETLVRHMIYTYLRENPYMLAALANSMLSANDPYSAYYSANSGFLDSTSKSFGIIITETPEDSEKYSKKGVYIEEVLADSNALFAGILPGDRFVSVEGMDVTGLTATGIKTLISLAPFTAKTAESSSWYQKFSDVNCNKEQYEKFKTLDWDFTKEVDLCFERILHDGSSMTVNISLPRGMSSIKEVYLYINPETGNATIQITSFNSENLAEQFIKAFNKAHEAGCKNLIIDLRDNPGGYFGNATAIGSLFTQGEQVLCYTRKRTEKEPLPTLSTGNYMGDKFEKYVVLTNGETASAAELLAFIMRDKAGAVLIGENTYGKALGQDVYTLINGDKFAITSLEVLTPDMESYNDIGLAPDVYIPLVPEKYEFPTGLSHFNHTNYVEIVAFEQRMGIIGIMHEDAIDGVCDGSTLTAAALYKSAVMGTKTSNGEITYDMVTSITDYINIYKDKYIITDSQADVAELYLENRSRGKRLASEYLTALKKYNKLMEQQEAERQKELDEFLEQEAKAGYQEEDVQEEQGE